MRTWPALMLFVGAARADAPDTDVTLRLDLPSFAVAGDDGWFQIFGGAASLRTHDWLAGEVAADYGVNACTSGLALTARAGVVPSVAGRTARWNVRVPVLAGVMYAPLSGGGCDQNPDEELFAVIATTGVELVHRGFAVRLIGFSGPQSYDINRDDRGWRTLYGVTLSLGVAIR